MDAVSFIPMELQELCISALVAEGAFMVGEDNKDRADSLGYHFSIVIIYTCNALKF